MGYCWGHSLVRHGDSIYVGMNGKAARVDIETGEIKWINSLKGCGYSIVTLILEKNTLFAASGGKFYGLDLASGETKWRNKLPGLGIEELSVSVNKHNTDFNSTTLPHYISSYRKNNSK